MKLETVLRAWRCHEEMTQKQAAEAIGIPYTTYQEIERGTMGAKTLIAVIRWLLSE